jgi:hypothetical protein
MAAHERAYRSLVVLYPKSFRQHYGDDLEQAFADLVDRDGPARAWGRTAIDLVLTAPRYRLENVMSPKNTNLTLNLVVAGLALGGVMSLLTGVYPGMLLLAAALVLGIVQLGKLAKSTRIPDPDRRRRLFRTALVLGVLCIVGTTAMFFELMDDENWHAGKLTLYNLYFFATLFGALGYLLAGLLTPRRPTANMAPATA